MTKKRAEHLNKLFSEEGVLMSQRHAEGCSRSLLCKTTLSEAAASHCGARGGCWRGLALGRAWRECTTVQPLRKVAGQALPEFDVSYPISLEKEMTTHSSILAWKIPRMEEPVSYSPWGRKELDTTE